ncbi:MULTISPECIES: hypothetical protein [Variovorax]|uniref:hypothetical protein n=1 Tax=Variovorax TaxID=34072 RepID=UPI002856C0FA|nr:hypothetical protein [Variovorax sp. 3319]MDR6886850.1 hypothetical protein [Variovorax sp. 3319]
MSEERKKHNALYWACDHFKPKSATSKVTKNMVVVTFETNKGSSSFVSLNDPLLYQISDGLRPRYLRHEKQEAPRKTFVFVSRVAKKIAIARAPGFGFCHFLGHFCPKDFREEVLEALHADALTDYQATLANGDHLRARIIALMMYIWMLQSILGGVLSWAFEKLVGRVASGD